MNSKQRRSYKRKYPYRAALPVGFSEQLAAIQWIAANCSECRYVSDRPYVEFSNEQDMIMYALCAGDKNDN